MTTTGPELKGLLLTDYFTTLQDPRRNHKGEYKYSLEELIFLTLSAVVSGFQTYELIVEYLVKLVKEVVDSK